MFKNLLRLIRFPNLLMIALTQIVVEYSLIIPVLKYDQQEIQFPVFYFGLLVLSTVLIAAGGYIINDYSDVEMDKINKPDKVVVGKYLSLQETLNIYTAITLLGIIIALYLALQVQLYVLVFIQVLVAGLLYFYAINYKRQLLIGNIIISLLSALTVILPFIYEAVAEAKQVSAIYIYCDIIFIYAGFSFITTLIREIIKDIEDMQGDQMVDCKTLPIVIGINYSKIILLILLQLTLGSIAFLQHKLYSLNEDIFSQVYIGLFIQIPILFLIHRLVKAKDKKDFSFASLLIKLIMLSGILSMPVLFVLIYGM